MSVHVWYIRSSYFFFSPGPCNQDGRREAIRDSPADIKTTIHAALNSPPVIFRSIVRRGNIRQLATRERKNSRRRGRAPTASGPVETRFIYNVTLRPTVSRQH